MWFKFLNFAVFFCLLSVFSSAQNSLTVVPAFQQAYKKNTRSTSGAPGKAYWQNTSNYDLSINFNPSTRLLDGKVNVVYTNNSPDTLKEIWLKLYPNLYKKGVAKKSKIAESDLNDGVNIKRLASKGKTLSDYKIDGTNMTVSVPPVLPGKSISLSIDYQYYLNKGSHLRTGQVDDGAFFIAYFFPRIAVYDDIDGWNKYPYTGAEEFYNDFDHFKVEITLPGDYAVWATGELKNPSAIYQKEIVSKLQQAENNDALVDIITAVDLKEKKVLKPQNEHTFKFEAENVTDFAFATSNHYLWKSSSLVVDPKTKRRTRVDAVFNEKHKDYEEVVQFARKTVEAMSFQFPKWPFPYQHETVFDGLDQMEYPMMVNDNPVESRTDAITLTDHEIFHTLFPFYMGINETKYGWMDEGWATIGEWLISPMIDSTIVDIYGIEPTESSSGSAKDTPIVTLTPDLEGIAAFTNSYPKPGLGYLYVKDYLGDELFTKALHHYINNWQGKHPMPLDFFNSINEGCGKNLNWFWNKWFFGGGVLDMAIKNVEKNTDGYQITIENKGEKPLPIDLNITYRDGSVEKKHQSIGIWAQGEKSVKMEIKTTKIIKQVTMNDPHTPDQNKNDNSFNL